MTRHSCSTSRLHIIMSLALVLPLMTYGDACRGTCRYNRMALKGGYAHSPPPPPPLDTWTVRDVEGFVAGVRGMNDTAFKEANIDGAALHELFIERTEHGSDSAALGALTKDADLGTRLRFFHKLRGFARDANAPHPPPPPPPGPEPPPSPGAPRVVEAAEEPASNSGT